MTIDELLESLNRIPDDNAINKARRRAIILEIIRLQNGGNDDKRV